MAIDRRTEALPLEGDRAVLRVDCAEVAGARGPSLRARDVPEEAVILIVREIFGLSGVGPEKGEVCRHRFGDLEL